MAEEEEEEVDYMSDAFLASICDVKPGLITARSVNRQRETEHKRVKGNMLSRAATEEARREEGLQKEVGPDNKGFGLLLKMGYKPGSGLGKNEKGRSEPVPIEVPKERAGLGRVAADRERTKVIQELRRQCVVAVQDQFRGAMAAKFRLGKIQRQLDAARHLCHKLDIAKSIEIPVRQSFWPETVVDANVKKTQVVVKKRRHEHTARSNSSNKRHTSDDSEDDFYEAEDFPDRELEDDELVDLDEQGLQPQELEPENVLESIIIYLRSFHLYCFWCSAQYDNEEQLNEECPGPGEDLH